MKDDAAPFIDANILVYAFDRSEGKKNRKAKQLLKKCFKGEVPLATSTQTLSEFFVTATKKIQKPITCGQANSIVRKIIDFRGFSILTIKPSTIVAAIDTHSKTKAHYWDALIAETMKENKMFHIYTENTNDFKRISEIKATNPLR